MTVTIASDDDDMSYLVTGTGKNAEEAIECFKNGYEDMKKHYAEEGKEFEEAKFDYEYDMASFLSYYSKAFSLAGSVTNHGHQPRTVEPLRNRAPRAVR